MPGSGNSAPSVLAVASRQVTVWPAGMVVPATSISRVVIRGTPGTGVSQRNSSSSQSGVLGATPVCQIGGLSAPVGFAGVVSPGLYQLNVTVPPAAPDGDNTIRCSYSSFLTPATNLINVQR